MAWCRHAIFAVRDDAVDWHNDNLRCHHCTYKMPIRYILSSVWVRLSIFSPLSIIQYVGLYVFSLPISHVMIERVYILCLIIIIKSEVWTITHCLGLGHETMVFAVCLSIFLLTTKLASWQFSVFSNCHIFTVYSHLAGSWNQGIIAHQTPHFRRPPKHVNNKGPSVFAETSSKCTFRTKSFKSIWKYISFGIYV